MSRSKKDRKRYQKKQAKNKANQASQKPKAVEVKKPLAERLVSKSEVQVSQEDRILYDEMKNQHDQLIEQARFHLSNGDLEQTRQALEQARFCRSLTKKIKGLQPIKPGDIRHIGQLILDADRANQQEKDRRALELKRRANEEYERVSRLIFIKKIDSIEFVGGKKAKALEMINALSPDIMAADPRIGQLKKKIDLVMEEHLNFQASRFQEKIEYHAQRDTDVALAILEEVPPEVAVRLDMEKIRSRIDEFVPQAQAFQLRKQELEQNLQERKRQEAERVSRQREKAEAQAYLEEISGSRQNPIKPGHALRNLRKAEMDDPEKLARAVRLNQFGSIDEYRRHLQSIRDQAHKIWQGYQELEFIESATQPEQVMERLCEVIERDLLINGALNRTDIKIRLSNLYKANTQAYRDKIDQLLNSGCRACVKMAEELLLYIGADVYPESTGSWFDEEAEGWDHYAHKYNLYSRIRDLLIACDQRDDCGAHGAKAAPWQQSRSRDISEYFKQKNGQK